MAEEFGEGYVTIEARMDDAQVARAATELSRTYSRRLAADLQRRLSRLNVADEIISPGQIKQASEQVERSLANTTRTVARQGLKIRQALADATDPLKQADFDGVIAGTNEVAREARARFQALADNIDRIFANPVIAEQMKKELVEAERYIDNFAAQVKEALTIGTTKGLTFGESDEQMRRLLRLTEVFQSQMTRLLSDFGGDEAKTEADTIANALRSVAGATEPIERELEKIPLAFDDLNNDKRPRQALLQIERQIQTSIDSMAAEIRQKTTLVDGLLAQLEQQFRELSLDEETTSEFRQTVQAFRQGGDEIAQAILETGRQQLAALRRGDFELAKRLEQQSLNLRQVYRDNNVELRRLVENENKRLQEAVRRGQRGELAETQQNENRKTAILRSELKERGVVQKAGLERELAAQRTAGARSVAVEQQSQRRRTLLRQFFYARLGTMQQEFLLRRRARLGSSLRNEEALVRSNLARQQALFTRTQQGIIGAVTGQSLLGSLFRGGLLVGGGFGVGRAFNIGADFQQGLKELRVLLGLGEDEVADIRQVALNLGEEVQLAGVSAADALEALLGLSKAGLRDVVQNADAAEQAARSTLLLARAQGVAADEAARVIADSINVLGLASDQTGLVADVLTALSVTGGGLSFNELQDQLKQSITVFEQLGTAGLSAEDKVSEMAVAFAALGRQGLRGSDAGTAFRVMLQGLAGRTDQAREQLEGLAASVGESGSVFFDSEGNLRSFRDAIGILERSLVDLSDAEQTELIQKIFGTDASRAVLALLGEGTAGLDALTQAIEQEGLAAELVAAKNKGLRGAIDALGGVIETQIIKLYELIDVPVGDFLNRITDAFSTFLTDAKFTAIRHGILGVTAALAGFVAVKTAVEVLGLLAVALPALLTPMGGLVLAAGALGAALGTIPELRQEIVDLAGAAVRLTRSGIVEFLDGFSAGLGGLLDVGDLGFLGAVGARIGRAFAGVPEFLEDLREVLLALARLDFTSVASGLVDLGASLGIAALNLGAAGAAAVLDALELVVDVIGPFFVERIIPAIGSAIGTAIDVVAEIGERLREPVLLALGALFDAARTLIGTGISLLGAAFGELVDLIASQVTGDRIAAALGGIRDGFAVIGEFITRFFYSREFLSALTGALAAIGAVLASAAAGLLEGLIKGLIQNTPEVVDFFLDLGELAVSALVRGFVGNPLLVGIPTAIAAAIAGPAIASALSGLVTTLRVAFLAATGEVTRARTLLEAQNRGIVADLDRLSTDANSRLVTIGAAYGKLFAGAQGGQTGLTRIQALSQVTRASLIPALTGAAGAAAALYLTFQSDSVVLRLIGIVTAVGALVPAFSAAATAARAAGISMGLAFGPIGLAVLAAGAAIAVFSDRMSDTEERGRQAAEGLREAFEDSSKSIAEDVEEAFARLIDQSDRIANLAVEADLLDTDNLLDDLGGFSDVIDGLELQLEDLRGQVGRGVGLEGLAEDLGSLASTTFGDPFNLGEDDALQRQRDEIRKTIEEYEGFREAAQDNAKAVLLALDAQGQLNDELANFLRINLSLETQDSPIDPDFIGILQQYEEQLRDAALAEDALAAAAASTRETISGFAEDFDGLRSAIDEAQEQLLEFMGVLITDQQRQIDQAFGAAEQGVADIVGVAQRFGAEALTAFFGEEITPEDLLDPANAQALTEFLSTVISEGIDGGSSEGARQFREIFAPIQDEISEIVTGGLDQGLSTDEVRTNLNTFFADLFAAIPTDTPQPILDLFGQLQTDLLNSLNVQDWLDTVATKLEAGDLEGARAALVTAMTFLPDDVDLTAFLESIKGQLDSLEIPPALQNILDRLSDETGTQVPITVLLDAITTAGESPEALFAELERIEGFSELSPQVKLELLGATGILGDVAAIQTALQLVTRSDGTEGALPWSTQLQVLTSDALLDILSVESNLQAFIDNPELRAKIIEVSQDPTKNLDQIKEEVSALVENPDTLTIPVDANTTDFETAVRAAIDRAWIAARNLLSLGASPSGTSRIPETAYGGIFQGRRGVGLIRRIGEAGAEAVIPLTKPDRAYELMQQSGLLALAIERANDARNQTGRLRSYGQPVNITADARDYHRTSTVRIDSITVPVVAGGDPVEVGRNIGSSIEDVLTEAMK